MKLSVRKCFVRALFICLYVIILFSLGETVIRFAKFPDELNRTGIKRIRTVDCKFNHKFVPCSSGWQASREFCVLYNINSFGLRDNELSIKKPKNTYRILAVGDSFVEGWGVKLDDSVSKVFERLLNTGSDNRQFEVINTGISGLSPILEYMWIKEKWIDLEPDLVMLFFTFCDAQNDMMFEKDAVFDENGFPVATIHRKYQDLSEKDRKTAIERFLNRNSAFYVFLRTRLKNLSRKIRGKKIECLTSPVFKIGDPESDLYFTTRAKPADIENAIGVSIKYLKAIDNLCREKDVKFIVVLFPMPQDVSKTEWSSGREAWGFEKNRIYYPHTAMEAYNELSFKYGIKTVSLFDDFRQSKNGDSFYFPYDGHWNKNGHKFVANVLYEKLKGENLW